MKARCPVCRCLLLPIWDQEFMTADREHFDRHPETSSYTRATFPTEHPFACAGIVLVQVLQLAPGVRARQAA